MANFSEVRPPKAEVGPQAIYPNAAPQSERQNLFRDSEKICWPSGLFDIIWGFD
jgi:hypothetical protein